MEGVAAWLRAVAEARAERVVDVPGGVAVLHDGLAHAHDHNRLIVEPTGAAADVVRAADDVLGGAGRQHRLVEAMSPPPPAWAATMRASGYTEARELVMVHRGPARSPSLAVQELSLAERVDHASRTWRTDLPDADPAVWEQLGERARTLAGAVEAVFLGIRSADGSVVTRADLYVRAGTAQVEEVLTQPEHRGRGHGAAVVSTAVARARACGAATVFLVTAADGRAQDLYRRLGFADAGTITAYSRT